MEDPREASRLRRKVDADAWVNKFLDSYLPPEGKVLEVGCGPGVLAAAAAKDRKDLSVTGIDLNPERFAESLKDAPANLRLLQADAHRLPFAADTYDFVYSRFLLEYLPDKSRAIREMVRVCRPGGRVLVQDLDGQLVWHYPEDAELEDGVRRVVEGLGMSGFDPFVGRKLFSLLRAAPLEDIRVSAETYHLFAGSIDSVNRDLWETKLDIVLPAATRILGSQSASLQLKERFMAYLDRADSLTYSTVFTVVGRKTRRSAGLFPADVGAS